MHTETPSGSRCYDALPTSVTLDVARPTPSSLSLDPDLRRPNPGIGEGAKRATKASF